MKRFLVMGLAGALGFVSGASAQIDSTQMLAPQIGEEAQAAPPAPPAAPQPALRRKSKRSSSRSRRRSRSRRSSKRRSKRRAVKRTGAKAVPAVKEAKGPGAKTPQKAPEPKERFPRIPLTPISPLFP